MELAEAALSSLLPKLGTLLTEKYKLHKRVRGEIRFLKAEMESILGALNKVSELPTNQINELTKIWVRDLKELVYDIEDSVDAFMVHVDAPVQTKSHSFTRFFDRIMSLLTKITNRNHITDDIQEIKRQIHDVSQRKQRYSTLDVMAQPGIIDMDPRLPNLYEDVAKLVGIDAPTEKIVDLLTRAEGVNKENLRVVSIVGVGGLGKTTVANSVYERLGGQFDCQAFVSVSLKPDMKQILSSMLRQVSKDKCTNAGEKDRDELLRSIRKFLIDKRYLIVIDDLWDIKAREIIKYALVDKNVGSRVIVTSRNTSVANFSSEDGDVYELDPLSDEDSRRLLCKRVFDEEDGIHSDLENVATKILKKCAGIPLVIITISSMLASRPNRTKYEWYSVYNAMGSGLENDKTLENMRKILHLSYSDLPSYLKPCLLYLSLFPEDYWICKSEIVRLWVAEGFVDENKGSNLYNIGERYFNELVNRSMIQPAYRNRVGVTEICHVHDMILDLIISIAAQENFSTIPEGPHLEPTLCKIRRVSLHHKVDHNRENKEQQMVLPATVDMLHVRSLIVFGTAIQWMPPVSRFPILRVLCLKFVSSKTIHAKELGSLHHLRYLELGGEVEPGVLEGIGNLKLLKTLNLWITSMKELPTSILQLRQLENLIMIGHTALKLPDGIGNLTSLQELSELDVKKSPNTLVELSKLTELQVLTISEIFKNDRYLKNFLQSLSNLCKLRTLQFRGIGGPSSLDSKSDQWGGPAHLQAFDGGSLTFSELPRWFSSLSELSCLSIKVMMLRQVDLQLLGSLPVLRFLNLHADPRGTTEERLVIGTDQPFRSLEEFKIARCSRCWLVFGQGVMSKLQRLELYFYVRTREGGGFDVGLENLASLKHVTVRVDCDGACLREVKDVETKIRDAVDSHPNHPILMLSRIDEWSMLSDGDESDMSDD